MKIEITKDDWWIIRECVEETLDSLDNKIILWEGRNRELEYRKDREQVQAVYDKLLQMEWS